MIGGEFPFQKLSSSNDKTLLAREAFIEIKAGVKIKAEGKVYVVKYNFKADFHGKGGVFYKIIMGTDEQGLFYTHSVGNTSIEVSGSVVASVDFDAKGGKNKGKYVDSEKSGSKNAGVGVKVKTFPLLGQDTWLESEKQRFENK